MHDQIICVGYAVAQVVETLRYKSEDRGFEFRRDLSGSSLIEVPVGLLCG